MQNGKVVARAELPRQKVVFATPSFLHGATMENKQSAIETEQLLWRHGISSVHRVVCGDQFIARARNRLTMDFFTEFPDATDIFWIDDDLGWPAEKVVEFLKRPENVVCGVYPKKEDNYAIALNELSKFDTALRQFKQSGGASQDDVMELLRACEAMSAATHAGLSPQWPAVFEVENGKFVRNDAGYYSAILAPGGFMRIKRPFFQELANGRPAYHDDNGDGSMALRYNLFESGPFLHGHDGWTGEDSDLCSKIRAFGERIWVDADITFAHSGRKRYVGNMAAFLAANAALIEKSAEEAWKLHEAEIAEQEAA